LEGVAGGASAAARLRRLDENAEIVIFERGASCHLPIAACPTVLRRHHRREEAARATPELLRDRFRIEVHTEHEVPPSTVPRMQSPCETFRTVPSGKNTTIPCCYPQRGAHPTTDPGHRLAGRLHGAEHPDVRQIRAWIDKHAAKRAVIVGGGFIGLEMAENLRHRGLDVTIIEKLDQLMPPLDPEMAIPVRLHLRIPWRDRALGDGLASLTVASDGRLTVRTEHNLEIPADLVILSIGVRPETQLAKAAALTIGPRGGIVVDSHMRTSDPAIWAVGDAVEISDVVTASAALVPLAGPANVRPALPPRPSPDEQPDSVAYRELQCAASWD